MPQPIDPDYGIYSPTGLVDSKDGNNSRQGAMLALANLIPDPETPNFYVCRAAAYALTSFSGFSTPGYVSVEKTIGNLVVGMIASARFPGFDEPYIYNLTTGAFLTISSVNSGNVPASPATSGAWTPPTIDAVGGFIAFTHPGFSGSNYIGLITISGSSYTWSAGNTSTNALPSIPTSVTVFFDRAYYMCGNLAYFSDSVAPGTITNSTQFLTVGGADTILASAGQPFFTTSNGGILAALLIFKMAQIWQVTGDAATNNLMLNKIADGVGTDSPRSIASTPLGVMFRAPDGIRTVSLNGQVSEANPDLTTPFLNPIVPSRIAAAYNMGYYRICTNYLQGGVLQTSEFWFSTKRTTWCGPHTLTYDGITGALSTFLVSGPLFTGQLLQTNVIPNEQTDFYSELGSSMSWTYETVLVPELKPMQGWSITEAMIFMGYQLQQTITAQVLDEADNILGSYSMTTQFLAPSAPTNWELNFQDSSNSGVIGIPSRHKFKLTGTSSMNLGLGTLWAHYQYQSDKNALAIVPYGGADLDFGLVTDPILNVTMDWGGVSDMVLATVDFETTGTHPGNP